MNIAIVTNMNGIGLQRDYELLNEFLTKRGHNVFGVQFDQPDVNLGFLADLTIFLEVIPTNFLGLGKVNWAILNAEWCKPDVLRAGQRMDRVFAKTFEGQRKMRDHFEKVFYCGFLTRDQGIEGMEKKLEFLHVGGNSSVRGTQAVFDAWKWKKNGARIEARLNIVSSLPIEIDTTDKRIYWWKHIDEAGLKHLQNSCAFHIYPSGTEGFGHAIHESLSTGAVLLTTDGPPMNEIHAGVKMKATVVGRQCLADLYEVSAIDIYEAAQDSLVKWRDGVISQMVDLARNEFLKDNEEFETLFGAHLADLENPEAKPVAVRSRSLNRTVAFIGNFKATESTENMIRIALEEGLNHDVETLQENEVNYPALKSAAKHAKMLLWVRTPNWLKIPDPHMNDLLAQLRADKIPTVSIHLDKFFGIPEREALVGNIPFWKTEHVFTADGSPAAAGFFRARGVNHHWMKPAVSEIYCHPGRPWDMYRCDVGFVGAKDYHAEYPFRRELVDWLEKQYVGRFRHITDLRGHGLNDFYASCSVVVGDCIFAGVPRYWSDRVPETVGRHGFLVHPKVEGLDIPHWGYEPQNLESLGETIEDCLSMSHADRKYWSKLAAGFVQITHTWEKRMSEILEVVLG